ncbi:MAG: sensor histidine kinase [Desulfarculus sp.]|nr:sensor histidine kinase [Desulfarculus sp.]
MLEISLHLMDLIENSLMAGARLVSVRIEEDPPPIDRMAITIADDGKGMPPEFLARVTDPFVTTRTTRRVGLGLGLMQANARAWGGDLTVASEPGVGTTVRIWFQRSHLDRPPLGDWAGTLVGLIVSRPEVDFEYYHRVGEDEFELCTRQLRQELGATPLHDPAVIAFLRDQVRQALETLGADRAEPCLDSPARA